LTLDVLIKTMFIETRVIPTLNRDFVFEDAIRSSAVYSEFTWDGEGGLHWNVGMFIGTIGIGAVGEEFAVLGLFTSDPVDRGARMTHIALSLV
jgi:hypothetical protein